jgi:chemotaxis protein MotB
MRLLLPLGVAVLLCSLVGCAGGGSIGGGGPPVDSLRAENARLRAENRSLRDSLRFRRDLDTGQYYRERRTLQDHLNRLSYEARLLRDGGLTVAVLSVDALFAGADSLGAAGRARLDSVARQLQRTYPNRTVRVEGHADDTPLTGRLQARFESNWELSTARATTVLRALIDRTALNPDQFVAVGYGASRPRAANDTAAGRRRNRRVRVAVLPLPKEYVRPFEMSW